MRRRHPRALGLLAGLGLATLLAVPAGAQSIEDDLRDTREELAEAREDFEQVTVEARRASEELVVVERRLVDVAGQLRELEAEVETASAAWEQAQAATLASSRDVVRADREIERAQAELDQRQQALDDRVRAAYMYGPRVTSRFPLTRIAAASAADPDDVLHGTEIMERVTDAESLDVAGLADLRADLVERKAELAEVRAQLRDQELVAERLREDVEAAVARQEVVRDGAAADRRRQDRLVAQLEAAQAAYEEQIASLEAESKKLEEKLKASQWRAGAPGKGTLVWPTSGNPGSPFGYRIHPIYGSRRLHTGVDIGAPTGQNIVAAADGLVVEAGWKGGYGNAVVIDHGGGVATLYAHQSRLAVRAGVVVSQGQVVGYIGSTGASTGPHLHFEVRVRGVPQDPMAWYR